MIALGKRVKEKCSFVTGAEIGLQSCESTSGTTKSGHHSGPAQSGEAVNFETVLRQNF